MKEKKFNFVYITTNLINNKKYVGEHSSDNLDCAKTKKYLGSGYYINNAIKLHGKENFKREILRFFPTKKEAFDAQIFFIEKYNTLNPNGYNISPAGGNWEGIKGCVSEETKQKMRTPKSQETKEKFKLAWVERRKIPVSQESRDKNGRAQLGKKRTQECKDKIGYSNTIRTWKDESKEKIRKSRIGKTHSAETKEKIGVKFPCIYCGKEMNAGNLYRYHNENCKKKPI